MKVTAYPMMNTLTSIHASRTPRNYVLGPNEDQKQKLANKIRVSIYLHTAHSRLSLHISTHKELPKNAIFSQGAKLYQVF